MLEESGYISNPSCVSIGNNVEVQAENCSHKVHIGRNVQIGPYVSISDRTAGDGSILGAHSVIAGPVVTKVFIPETLEWTVVNGETERDAALALRREYPLLSIVIPTYNRAHHLNNNLHSIYTQICDDDLVEVVISDNASPDQTQQIGERYVSLFSSVQISEFMGEI